MERSLRSILFCLLLSAFANAQVPLSVPGIIGLSFTKTDTSYTLPISEVFRVHGVQISPDSLFLKYDNPTSRFTIFGTGRAVVEDSALNVSLGTVNDPGILIGSDTLIAARFAVQQAFGFKSLTLIPDSLWFSWKADTVFAMYGSLAVVVGTDTINVSANTANNPGILMLGGRLSKLELLTTARFSVKGVELLPDSLGFTWLADSSFGMHGRLSVVVASDSIITSAGSRDAPGIQFSGGRLLTLDLSVSGRFIIKNLTFLPDSVGIRYREADSSLAIHGSLTAMVSSDSIKVVAGTVLTPGIVITNGELRSLNLTASARFSLKALTLLPDSLGIHYRSTDSSYAMYGSLSAIVSGDTVTMSAGTAGEPGIVIAGGRLTRLQLLASGTFTLKSLTFIPDSLGFTWLADSDFAMHGSLSVIVSTDTIRVSAGHAANPGIVLTGGALSKLQLLVSAKFSIKALTFIPDSLGFSWRSDSTFALHGSLSVLVGTDSVKVSAGTIAEPGIEFSGGKLTKLALQAGGKFSVKSLTFIPDSLGFTWEADSGFAMFGRLSVLVAADTFRVSAGSLAEPGIVITQGRLVRLRLLTSAEFALKSLKFIADSLGFEWVADSSFALHGSLSFVVATDTVKVSAGTTASPGIAIAGGRLVRLQLAVSSQFSFKGITVLPHNVGFSWIGDTTNTFAMYGNVTVAVDSSRLTASFGTLSQPGFTIVNGVVTRWALSLSDTLKLTGVKIVLTDASLVYDAGNQVFSIWGGGKVCLSNDTVSLTLGNEAQPGLRLVNGKVTSVSAGVTASFKVAGLTLSPDNLTFSWNDSTRAVKLYGSLKAAFEGSVTTFFAGTKGQPGIEIVNGSVRSLSLGVSTDLHLASLLVKPRGLTFAWADSGFFKLYGSATMLMAADSVSVVLGDSSNPGMLIAGGTLEHFNVGVTADFHLKTLRIQPKALTFRYDKPTGSFSLFGGIAVHLAGDSIAAILGDSTNPGMVYTNGSVKHINIGISAGFTLKNLSIRADSLRFVWSGDSNYYALSGGAGIRIGTDSVDCRFGTGGKPGLIFRDGQLRYLSIDVNSDIKIGNIDVRVQDLDLVYENAKYTLKGTCTVKQVFSVSLALGSGGTPGIILDVSTPTPQLQVNDLLFEIAHANLGAIDLKDFKLAIKNGQIANSTVNIAFPGGWEVGAGIAFTGSPARIDSIGVDWTATSIQSAIALPNGMLLAGMRGSLKHLSTPSQMEFGGELLLLYGGPVAIKQPGSETEREGALLYLRTFATVSRTGITLGSDAKVGAYRVDANWNSTLGEGTLTLAVLWGRNAKLQGDFKIPSAPNQMVEIKPLVYLDSHKNFDALLDVTFYVPGFIPFVGGQQLGNAAGAMRYRNGDLWHSYAAAWVSGSTLWWDWTVGAKYNFGSREIHTIDGGAISDIRRDIADDTRASLAPGGKLLKVAGRPVRSIIHSFTTIRPSPSLLVVSLQWPHIVDSTVVTVLGPEGFYELTRVEEMSGDSISSYSQSQPIERDFAVVSRDSLASFIVAPYSSFTNDSTVDAVLPPGQYQVVCTSYDVQLDSVGLVVAPMYVQPKADIWLTDGPVVHVKYSSVRMDSTLMDIYASDSPSYSGRVFSQCAHVGTGPDGTAQVDTTFAYSVQNPWIGEKDSLWFYSVVEDGLNPPHLSGIVGPYYVPPALRGTISVTSGADTVTTGLLVFSDSDNDGGWDTPSTGGPEIHTVTDSTGRFRIPALTEGIHRIRVVVPSGYTLLSNDQPISYALIDYRGLPLELNLRLQPSPGTP